MATAGARPRGPAGTSPALSLVLAATVALFAVLAAWDAGHTRAAADLDPTATDQHAASAGVRAEQEAPDPVGVRSDAVDIESPTIPLGKRDDGRLEVPEDAHTAGWWTGRANPGERGPAVIVGHVDSRSGPGAFWELPDLVAGDRVSVDRADGTSLHWRVDRVEEHPKDDFPTEAVYGPTDEPTLRMVTCSGFFDADARSYENNTIVFLTLDEEQDPEVERALAPESDEVPGETVDEGEAPLELPAAGSTDALELPAAGSAEAEDPTAEGDAPVEEPAVLDAIAAAVEPLGGTGERGVPIALALASLLVTAGAVGRELARRR